MTARKILIVGGGTAGWITAAVLAKTLGTDRTGGPSITLIESPEISIIGVGEATFPTIRETLKGLGIDEAEFMRETSATFKQGILFADWQETPENGRHNQYFHPFEQPYLNDGTYLLPYWLLKDPKYREPFAEAMTFQKTVTDARHGPKRPYDGNFSAPLNYAYHFDAARLAQMLSRFATGLGVKHLQGMIGEVRIGEDGAISNLSTAEHGDLEADLYIDCTGFRAELIGKALGVPFKSARGTLFTNRAVACQVPYPDPKGPIESNTISTAHEAGWTWDIGLDTRKGVGYVYSSDHTSDDRAEKILRAHIGPNAEVGEVRRLKFEAGHRERQWVKNCVCVGLAGGFLEPLESTGIVLIEAAARMIADFFPQSGAMDAPAKRFNQIMSKRYETIIDFLKLHFCLSRRTEPFWRDNAEASTYPERLTYFLEQWKRRPPNRYDFDLDHECFAFFSYQYILYGMGFQTDFEAARGSYPNVAGAQKIFDRVKTFGTQAVKDLPTHRDLVTQIYTRGFLPKPSERFNSVRTGSAIIA